MSEARSLTVNGNMQGPMSSVHSKRWPRKMESQSSIDVMLLERVRTPHRPHNSLWQCQCRGIDGRHNLETQLKVKLPGGNEERRPPLFAGHPSRQQTTNGRAFENSRGQDLVGSQSQAQRNRLRTLLPFHTLSLELGERLCRPASENQ